MGRRNRIVRPETVRLDISDGDWIEIKRELNAGESKDLFADVGEIEGDDIKIDPLKMSFAMVQHYVVGWSLEQEMGDKDEGGDPVVGSIPLNEESIRALDQGTFNEISTAIANHVNRLDEEKKVLSGKAKPEPK